MSEAINQNRRHFLRNTALTLAAAPLAAAFADPQSSQSTIPPIRPGTNTSFGALKQINAGLLNVGYAEAGPANGPAVLLLHGWPYDIYSFVDVAPLLALAGYRVIVPYLRGYGTTHFLSSETMRNAQQSAVALDIIALMDALKIQTATVAGRCVSHVEAQRPLFRCRRWHRLRRDSGRGCPRPSGAWPARRTTHPQLGASRLPVSSPRPCAEPAARPVSGQRVGRRHRSRPLTWEEVLPGSGSFSDRN